MFITFSNPTGEFVHLALVQVPDTVESLGTGMDLMRYLVFGSGVSFFMSARDDLTVEAFCLLIVWV